MNEQTARDRKWIINLIRSEYDKAPDYFKAGDNWDDGTGSIADQIITRCLSRSATVTSTPEASTERASGPLCPYCFGLGKIETPPVTSTDR
jgi:hypothetical protein